MSSSISRVLIARSCAYFVVLLTLCFFSNALVLDGSPSSLNAVYMVLVLVTAGQAIAALTWTKNLVGLLPLFIADLAFATVLIRATGASASPFLVLFPLTTLSAAVLFKPVAAGAVLVVSVFFVSRSVGSGVSIIGYALANITVSALGMYLSRALNLSGTQLQKSEDARRRLEGLQKAILANIPSGLLSMDSEGRVIQVNGVGLRILGQRESDVIHARVSKLFPSIDAERLKLNTLVPVAGGWGGPGDGTINGDRPTVRYEKPNGEVLQLGYSVARLQDPDNQSVMGSLIVFQDLTEVLKLEDAVRTSQKLAAVGKLASSIAHEIRNPLASISGSAQLLSQLSGLSEEDTKLLSIIRRESSRLDDLITDFLEYVRTPQLKLETVNLVSVSRAVLESLAVNAKWTALGTKAVVHNNATQAIHVQADANRVTQVLMNLLLNAGQAGAKNVDIRCFESGELWVCDDGPGISAEHQKRLFEPFFTTKAQGTGLGLATSYRVLEAMQAKVWVRSPPPPHAPFHGTMFVLQFKKGVSA